MADQHHIPLSDIGRLDYATVERRIEELLGQLHCVRGIIGTVSDSVECMLTKDGRATGRPRDPIFALIAARDLLNEMEGGLDVNQLLAPTDEDDEEVPS